MATGEENGYYFRFGEALKSVAQPTGLDVEVLASAGSVDNVKLLLGRQADFALVQSDIGQRAIRGHDPFPSPLSDLRLVSPLFTEAVHVLRRSGLYIFGVSDLRGKRVSLGPSGSGTEFTARAVLEASGVGINEIQQRPLRSDEIVRELQNETIDAVFLTSAVPNHVVKDSLQCQEASPLFLDVPTVERLARTGSYFTTEIPVGAYKDLGTSVTTVGVGALLLTRADVSPSKIQSLFSIIHSQRQAIEKKLSIHLNLLNGWDADRFHVPVAAGITTNEYGNRKVFFLYILVALLACVLIVALLRRRQALGRVIAKRSELFFAFSILAFVLVFSSLGLYEFEHAINENFETVPKSVFSFLVYISGGFTSRAPITRGGEIVAIIAILMGVGVFAWFTATLAGHLVSSRLKALEDVLLGRWSMRQMSNHIVIINWSHLAEDMIQQLHGRDFKTKRPITIISDSDLKLPNRPEFENCSFLRGDAREISTLEAASVGKAHSVIILSAWPDQGTDSKWHAVASDIADSKSVLTILAVRRVCAQSERQTPVTVEIRSSVNVDAARSAGRGGPTEIACTEKLAANLLTQCAVTPGLVAVYDDLLTFAPDSDEIYQISLPASLTGKTFAEVARYFAGLDRRDKKGSLIPVGIYRDCKVYLNPPEDMGIGALRESDKLFVICDHIENSGRS